MGADRGIHIADCDSGSCVQTRSARPHEIEGKRNDESDVLFRKMDRREEGRGGEHACSFSSI